jgi:hypothetical protein
MKGRAPTKAEQAHMDAMAQVGCIVCILHMGVWTPPAIHHIDGKTKPGAHFLTIPLCSRHHQYKSNTGAWVSRHGDGRRAFEAAYGAEEWLLERAKELCRKSA